MLISHSRHYGAVREVPRGRSCLLFAQAKTPPARLILLGRSENKIQPAIDRISEINGSVKTKFIKIDLSDNASIRTA